MLLYILVILLVNASYRSLGVPISPMANSLTALAKSCENAFLTNQINSKIKFCTEYSPNGDKQLHCLMFYDINKQLCSAVSASKLVLTEDYTAKINEEQDVNSMCIAAKEWTFSNLTEYLHYKQAVDNIFKFSVTCGKICGVEDFTIYDANFFCKYFKWGEEMLAYHVSSISTQETASNNQAPIPSIQEGKHDEAAATLKQQVQPSSDLQDVQIVRNTTLNNKSITPVADSSAKNEDLFKPEVNKPETSSVALNSLNYQSLESAIPEKPETSGSIGDTGPLLDNALAINDKASKSPEGIASKADTAQENAAIKPDTSSNNQLQPEDSLKTDVDKELELINNERKEPVLEGPKVKLPNDIDDYPDSDEGKDILSQVGDDGEDPLLGPVDTKPEIIKQDKKTEAIVSTFSGEKDYYTNSAQDVFPDGDDHFFPFFLSAVIMVVLLYVLYHNKNKVSKVFFGLILEGRQAGRRRNSRGHSYRRLDTLEQAMSASATAPPTKIIY